MRAGEGWRRRILLQPTWFIHGWRARRLRLCLHHMHKRPNAQTLNIGGFGARCSDAGTCTAHLETQGLRRHESAAHHSCHARSCAWHGCRCHREAGGCRPDDRSGCRHEEGRCCQRCNYLTNRITQTLVARVPFSLRPHSHAFKREQCHPSRQCGCGCRCGCKCGCCGRCQLVFWYARGIALLRSKRGDKVGPCTHARMHACTHAPYWYERAALYWCTLTAPVIHLHIISLCCTIVLTAPCFTVDSTTHAALHTVHARVRPHRPCINNKYRFLLGVLDQSYWPDGQYTAPGDAALASDLQAVKSWGR